MSKRIDVRWLTEFLGQVMEGEMTTGDFNDSVVEKLREDVIVPPGVTVLERLPEHDDVGGLVEL
ncbi:TPA: hypothetical protein DCZ32_03500, partial [Candidatus Uhrbacteria bacterium]|nr:hypothetical protein [Candidatus Uhrbacteria bacterium]